MAGTRIIPLTIQESKIKKIDEIGRKEGPVLEILPFRPKKVGIIITGSEIFEKRIKDRSAGIVRTKVEALGSRVVREAVVTDDVLQIASEIHKMKTIGCQVIIATGGLSVDPDDVTLEGIRKSRGGSCFLWRTRSSGFHVGLCPAGEDRYPWSASLRGA